LLSFLGTCLKKYYSDEDENKEENNEENANENKEENVNENNKINTYNIKN